MALHRWPALYGLQRSFRRIFQLFSWALARSPGPRSLAWARLACFCDSGLFLPVYGMRAMRDAPDAGGAQVVGLARQRAGGHRIVPFCEAMTWMFMPRTRCSPEK